MAADTDQREQTLQPAQHQSRRPGLESEMDPKPRGQGSTYRPAGKLAGKTALITGGDSGIGRAVAVLYAKEGADVAIIFLNERQDADETRRMVEGEGRKCLLISGDVGREEFCRTSVQKVANKFGRLDILRLSCLRRFVVHRGTDPAPERWRGRERLRGSIHP